MTDEPVRVMLQIKLGLVWRQAPDDVKSQIMERWNGFWREWKAAGVHLVGSISAPGQVGGFPNCIVLDMKDLAQVAAFDAALMRLADHIQDFCIHIGYAGVLDEETWAKL